MNMDVCPRHRDQCNARAEESSAMIRWSGTSNSAAELLLPVARDTTEVYVSSGGGLPVSLQASRHTLPIAGGTEPRALRTTRRWQRSDGSATTIFASPSRFGGRRVGENPCRYLKQVDSETFVFSVFSMSVRLLRLRLDHRKSERSQHQCRHPYGRRSPKTTPRQYGERKRRRCYFRC